MSRSFGGDILSFFAGEWSTITIVGIASQSTAASAGGAHARCI